MITAYRWLDGTRTPGCRLECHEEFSDVFRRCLRAEVRRQAGLQNTAVTTAGAAGRLGTSARCPKDTDGGVHPQLSKEAA